MASSPPPSYPPSSSTSSSSSSVVVDCSISSSIHLDRLLVLDFGSQYSHLIVRRLRDLSVYSELKRCDITIQQIKAYAPKGIILSGGPSSVYEVGAPHVCSEFWDYTKSAGVFVLGICYGMQEMVQALGGVVEKSDGRREFGSARMEPVESGTTPLHQDLLLQDLFPSTKSTATTASLSSSTPASPTTTSAPTFLRVWMSHGDRVTKLPDGFHVTAMTDSSEFAVIADPSRGYWGIQFHPEVTHTDGGLTILSAFARRVCSVESKWSMELFAEKEIERLRVLVGEHAHVIGAVSGGVDSTVAAALMHKAIGKRFHAFTVDTGLLRKGEAEEVLERLRRHVPGINLTCIDASERFLGMLKGVKAPEEKRKIIGRKFIEEFELAVDTLEETIPEIRKHNNKLTPKDINCNNNNTTSSSTINNGICEELYLLQGTLYPDVIESVSFKGPSHTIKTHHNVGGLPEHMKLKVLEPLRELFKDEVRVLGTELGIPHDSVWRHPFPGPGLGIRIIGEVTKERADALREADAIMIEEIRASGDYDKIGQAFVVLLPEAKSVGVMGDCRTYEMTACIRAVATTDYMTADWYRFDYTVLAKISSRIINEVEGINRVVYDVSSKPPATIEWE
eukprot:GHVS01101818.1.p1 GENE.GHVS01101818.1~~GHVS01101818.1.p1  ORF type:complete len:631 (+),score=89.57 GHVS01101818.1:32-1894(+)